MLTAIIDFSHHTQRALENGIDLKRITDLPVVAEIARMKEIPVDKAVKAIQELIKNVKLNFTELGLD
jgi:vacuolar-type H+-ATPase catalytic subunit A/Vma1